MWIHKLVQAVLIGVFSLGCLLMPLRVFASPLDDEEGVLLFQNVIWTRPELVFIGFENTEYIRLGTGLFRKKPWYAGTLDLQFMGNDIFAKRDERSQPYVHTLYLTFLKVGRTWDWNDFRFFADAHGGLLYTNSFRQMSLLGVEVENRRSAGLGLTGGVRWSRGPFQADLSLGIVGFEGQSLAESRLELQYRLSRKWKIGFFSEAIARGVELCTDRQEKGCQYEMKMVFAALYASWNVRGKTWLLFGFGGTTLTLGTDAQTVRESSQPAVYLGIR